jgi:dihydroxy-acid dehydratase
VLAARRAAMSARGEAAWRPTGRDRQVGTALRIYGLIASSADRGGARDAGRLAWLETQSVRF